VTGGDPASEHPPAPGLERFVAAARAQTIVGTCVTAEAVAAGLEHQRRRSQTRQMLWLSGAMAIAATLAAVALLGPLVDRATSSPGFDREGAGAQLELSHELGRLTGPRRTLGWSAPVVTIPRADPPTLAQAVRLRSTAPVEVRGPWAISLREGTHEIEVDPDAGHPLLIALPDRSLELVEGRVQVEFTGEPGGTVAAVRVETGVAAWVGPDGARTQVLVERMDLDGSGLDGSGLDGPGAKQSSGSSAAELARKAEELLATGKRDQAIASYQQLVRKHPRAQQSRAALLDLARLLRNAGREDEARCAYRLFLDRWPDSSVRAEVEAQLARLGPGPACPKR
jgi:hypothetical protein